MDLPRREDYFRIGAAELLDANEDVQLSAVLEDGADANLVINAIASMAEEVTAQLAEVHGNNYLATAQGQALVRRGNDRHQILPRPASPAFAELTFTLVTNNPTAFTIPSGTRVRSADGKQYETVADAPFPAGSLTITGIRARSQLAGRASMVSAGKLTSLTSTIAGAPQGMTVTNPAASAGAMEAEAPDDYRRRCQLEPRSRAKATRTALEAGALAVPGVIRASPFEGLDANGRANRIVHVVVSDEYVDGLVRQGVQVPAYEAQSQAFARVVEIGLDEVRAFGIHVGVSVSQVALVSFLLRLRFRAGANTEQATIAASAAVVRYTNALKPGVSVEPTAIVTALRAITGLDVRGDEVADPVGPIVPISPYQTLRTNLSLIQFTSAPVTAGAIISVTPGTFSIPI